RGSWRIRGHQHQVSAKGTVAGGDLAFSGGWDPKNISLSGTASHENLATLGQWIPALAKGGGTLEDTRWSITGAMGAPRIRFNGSVVGAQMPPASAGELGFHYDGTWG